MQRALSYNPARSAARGYFFLVNNTAQRSFSSFSFWWCRCQLLRAPSVVGSSPTVRHIYGERSSVW